MRAMRDGSPGDEMPGGRVAVAVMTTAALTGCGRLGFAYGHDGDAGALGYAAAVLADQPVAYWRLDETGATAADASGHGATGIYSGRIARGVAGALAGDPDAAVAFDDSTTDGIISVGASFDFSGTAAFTVEAWIKPSIVDNASRHVFTKQFRSDLTTKRGFAVLVRIPEDLVFERFADGAGRFATIHIAFDSEFHHVVATYDGAMMTLFVDGAIASQIPDDRPALAISNIATIGATIDQYNWFGGAIDEVAVYASALPPARVQAHFAAGSAPASAAR
jgi:hypothetical protein